MTDARFERRVGSEQLRQHIIGMMEQHPYHAIRFRDYMEMCLYHPEYGYYMRDYDKVGKKGDFYTSASIGTVLGDMLADYYISWAYEHTEVVSPTLVEWGGGNGMMASQVMERLRLRDPDLYERTQLIMIEYSPYHRKLQREQLASHARVRWIDEQTWDEEAPWQGVYMWANELLDAYPVHRVKMIDGVLHEIWVGWDAERRRYIERYYPVDEEIRTYIEELDLGFEEGQLAEINTSAKRWIMRLGKQLAASIVTLIDYGDESIEIYAAHRMLGTLMCYHQHRAADDPYVYEGEQDITAHVDFTTARRAALAAGFRDVRVESQAAYLLRGGVLGWLQDHHDPDPFSPVARRNRSIRQLLLSDQMSELFKVMTMHIGDE